MPSQESVTQFDTLDLFSTKTTFADEDNVFLYVYDTNEAADANKPGKIALSALEALIGGGGGGGGDLLAANNLSDVGNAATARANLGLTIGTHVQAYSAHLAALAAAAKDAGNFLVGDGSTWVVASGGTARSLMGVDGTGIASLLDAELANTRWRQGFVNTIGAIENKTTGQIYIPVGDTDAARGAALTTALGAVDNDQTIALGTGFTYEPAAKLTVEKNIRLRGNFSCIKRGASQTDWVLCIDAQAGGTAFVNDLEIHGNYGIVQLVSGSESRGEGIRLAGAGKIIATNIYSHDSPIKAAAQAASVDDAAVNFFVLGSGHKKLVNCTADNPSYANYRIQATTSEFLGCDSFVTTFTGNYGRFYVMDGAAIKSCTINGGTWQTAAAMKINANFDPSTDGSLWCERLTITNIVMDFGTGHTMPDGDSFIKFDNCRYVFVSNIIQTHSVPFAPHPTLPLSEPGTGFKWWLPTRGVRESLFTVGTCNEVHFENIVADGYVKLSGSTGGPYMAKVSMKNCVWGANAHIPFGIENCNHARHIIIEDCSFFHITGSGGTVKIFDNTHTIAPSPVSTQEQKIEIRGKCYITTVWTSNHGFLFSDCKKIGDVSLDDIDLIDMNTDDHVAACSAEYWMESDADDDVAYAAPTPASGPTDGHHTFVLASPQLRLMATPRPADPYTALLGRNVFRTWDYADEKFVNGELCTLATSGTYANTHRTPTDPGTETGDWFTSVTAEPGARIVNLGGGAGGNGYANFWLANAAGDLIEDPSIRSDSA